MIKMHARYTPEVAAKYADLLRQFATQHGLDPAATHELYALGKDLVQAGADGVLNQIYFDDLSSVVRGGESDIYESVAGRLNRMRRAGIENAEIIRGMIENLEDNLEARAEPLRPHSLACEADEKQG